MYRVIIGNWPDYSGPYGPLVFVDGTSVFDETEPYGEVVLRRFKRLQLLQPEQKIQLEQVDVPGNDCFTTASKKRGKNG